jgi:hypothetical protein
MKIILNHLTRMQQGVYLRCWRGRGYRTACPASAKGNQAEYKSSDAEWRTI